MNRKSVCLFSVTGFLLASILLAGCEKKENGTETEQKNSQIIVGFSQIGAESAWRTGNTKSMKDAAEAQGVQLIYSNAEQKQENQIKAIRSFIVYRVDVIAFVPIVEDGWDNVLREAKAADIPVIVVDRKIKTSSDDLYAGYIGENAVEEGRNAARFLQKKFSGQKNRKFSIAEIRGTDYSSVEEERHQGFTEIINGSEQFSIIYSESGDFLRSRGKEIAENIITTNNGFKIDGKPIDIVFCHNDAMALGMLDVLSLHHIETGKNIVFVSIDAEQEAIDALVAGRLNCVVECNPKCGPAVMELAKKLVNHEAIPRCTYVSEEVFSEFSNLSRLDPRGY